jgi:hypothetical protein
MNYVRFLYEHKKLDLVQSTLIRFPVAGSSFAYTECTWQAQRFVPIKACLQTVYRPMPDGFPPDQ